MILSSTKIVGLAGKKQAGKSTVARILEEKDKNLCTLSFAEPVKRQVTTLLRSFGLKVDRIAYYSTTGKEEIIPEIGQSFRYLCQTIGTDWGRTLVCDDIWLKVAKIEMESNTYFSNFVFDDVRFENEVEFIRGLGGEVYWVQGQSFDEKDNHSSENSLQPEDCDGIILNIGSIEDLEQFVLEILKCHTQLE